VANVAVPVSGETLLVNRGDSLWKIAQREFGDGRMWTLLWQANPQLADPNLIYAGQSLRRPAAEQIAQQRASRAASAVRASQKKQNSSDSFAAQVLARESRKASLRSSETLPSLLPAPLLDGPRSSGPPRSPR
jgi:Tfp pilus assembly protein FimV